LEHGAKMVDYAGFEMPLHYGSIIDEHHQVRNSAGLFDVSHMGRIKFSGPGAEPFLERVLSRHVGVMEPGMCRYALVCNEQGGVRDDVICYRFEDHWLLVVNAANREKLLEHFEAHRAEAGADLTIEDQTEKTVMVAIQGPKVIELFAPFSSEVPNLKRYRFCEKNLILAKAIISRTGYTGEDGVEVILPAMAAKMAVGMVLKQAGADQLKPAGLGCRDTLRLEAGMPLYGHELDEQTDPLSAGLGFAVSLKKGEGDVPTFIGQESLQRIALEGAAKKLIGLKLEGRRTPRQGAAVLSGGEQVGQVTSGCMSPTLGCPIAMAYVTPDRAEPGTKLETDFGKKTGEAEVVALPFYKAGG
ncbi:MAG: glycine cleavage system aminomethyltransferase GcvT, partial [Phycisphaeraceae bacterium]|nr:glycine cleavage system aminomethyltransferase GcvT [Phycisphaeraceae bacterium]